MLSVEADIERIWLVHYAVVLPSKVWISLNCGKSSSWDISIVMDFRNRCLKHGLMDPAQMREICLVNDDGKGDLILELRESCRNSIAFEN